MSNLYNLDAERYVVGGMLLFPECVEKTISVLSEDDFFAPENRTIFIAARDCFNAGDSTDFISVGERLEVKTGDDTDRYITSLLSNSTSIANINSHINRILSKSNARKMESELIKRLADLQSGVNSDSTGLKEIQNSITSIETDTGNETVHYKSMEQINGKLLDQLDDRMNPDTPNGLTTGISGLDEILGSRGFQAEDLIIIGGRPASGKTMGAGKIALHVALEIKRPSLIFSMEMGDTALMQRFISQGGRVNPNCFYDGEMLEDNIGKIQHAALPLIKSDLYIDDRSSLTLEQLQSSARKFKQQFPDAGYIMIDYIMLMKVVSNGRRQDQEYGEISLGILALAKELRVTMVVLSQCSKACESRPDKRPLASDLKEISQLEADATHVIMLYNESAYNEDTAMGKVIEFIVRKNRNGNLGTAYQEIKGGWMEDIAQDELCLRQDRYDQQSKKKKLKSDWNGDE